MLNWFLLIQSDISELRHPHWYQFSIIQRTGSISVSCASGNFLIDESP